MTSKLLRKISTGDIGQGNVTNGKILVRMIIHSKNENYTSNVREIKTLYGCSVFEKLASTLSTKGPVM